MQNIFFFYGSLFKVRREAFKKGLSSASQALIAKSLPFTTVVN
jgi:hypothetical protein